MRFPLALQLISFGFDAQFTFYEGDTRAGKTFGANLWTVPWFFQSSYAVYVIHFMLGNLSSNRYWVYAIVATFSWATYNYFFVRSLFLSFSPFSTLFSLCTSTTDISLSIKLMTHRMSHRSRSLEWSLPIYTRTAFCTTFEHDGRWLCDSSSTSLCSRSPWSRSGFPSFATISTTPSPS